jgi:hypothetical protein
VTWRVKKEARQREAVGFFAYIGGHGGLALPEPGVPLPAVAMYKIIINQIFIKFVSKTSIAGAIINDRFRLQSKTKL